MAKRRKGRPIDGVFILDKPDNMSSNGALQAVKRLFYAQKAGHTGSLDPLATGVLPICLGESTKFSQFLLDADKEYETTVRLGERTTTSDAEGEVVEAFDASHITKKMVQKALKNFEGEINQIPSMFSALKHNGQPLYKLARQGIEIERKVRQVEIYEIELLDFRPGEVAEVDLVVFCSKGTYIRSIAEDLGQDLEVGGHVSALRRTIAGPFDIEQALTLDDLAERRDNGLAEVLDELLLPVDACVEDVPVMTIAESGGHYLRHGQPIMEAQVYKFGTEGDMVRVYLESGEFIGLCEIDSEDRLAPKRVIVPASDPSRADGAAKN